MHDETKNQARTYQFNPIVLGKIFLLQTTLHVIPDAETLTEFLCHGLESIPGTSSVSVRINTYLKSSDNKISIGIFETGICGLCNKEFDDKGSAGISAPGKHRENSYCISIQTIQNRYGCILFEVKNRKELEPYQPFLENLANTVALIIQTKTQETALSQLNEELRKSKDQLEVLVKERTKELILKNEELDRFFDTSLDLLCIADMDGYFHRLNPEWGRMLGYAMDELIGKRFLDFIHPDDLDSTLAVISILKTQKEVIDFINRYRCKDGTYRWIEWRSTPAGTLIYAAARDITEHKLAETAIRDANQFNLQIINSAEEGIVVYDKDLRYKVWNPYMEQLSGFSAGEAIGKLPWELFPFLEGGGVVEKLHRALEGETAKSIDFPFKLKNGKTGWSSDTSAPLRNSDGEIIGVIATVRDITERKHIEEELIRAKEKAEEGEKIKSEFLAQISHEIRTPLNIILGLLNLIKEENPEVMGEKVAEDFRGINNAAGRITRTIDSILNMSQLHIGAYEGKKTVFNLNEEVIENIYLNYNRLAAEKGLKLNILTGEIDSNIYGDQQSVHQIFVNLIDNAIKFTNSGEISLGLRRDSAGRLVASVSDTGIGMSEDYLKRLFEPFSQEQHGYTREYDGNGLGLALVKNYCLYNNADIEVESGKGKGTRFTITFLNYKTASEPKI